ncbi:hypothetical protein [Tepidibacillus marianensis]|uniref:hypothetical protein n=1 Tax=Tepidibacillus marianensis TaxID=3131995 RepID=UPI0030CC981E
MMKRQKQHSQRKNKIANTVLLNMSYLIPKNVQVQSQIERSDVFDLVVVYNFGAKLLI